MTLRVSGKNLDIGESRRSHVMERIEFVASKYSASFTNGHVTIGREGSGFHADCCLRLDSGTMLQVAATAQDAYASVNLAAERIESRLRRHKGNLRRHKLMRDRMAERVAAASAEDRPSAAPSGPGEDATGGVAMGSVPIVIAESLDGLKEMSVSHAVKELDVTRGHVVVFRHSGDGRPNIVYRRSDGNIGWIDPALSPKA